MPFLANPQTSLIYPGSLLFYVLPVPYAYSASVVLHVFLAAAFTYLLLRRVVEVGPFSALLGAGAFAFGGAVSAQVTHINQLSSTPWLPAALLCADRAWRLRSRRWVALGALTLGVQLLAGHAQVTYMTGWCVAILLVWRVVEFRVQSSEFRVQGRLSLSELGTRNSELLRAVATGLGMAGLGAGLAAIQLIPTLELARESIRSGGLSYQEAVAFSLPPSSLARSLLPGYWAPVFSEFMGAVGTVPLAFAVLGLAFGRAGPAALGALLAAVGLVLAIGGANPLYPLLYQVIPGLGLFRVPARWLLVFTLGVAILAALGVHWALRRPHRAPDRRRAGLVLAAASAIAAAGLPSLAGTPGRIVVLWAAGLTAGGLLALASLRRPSLWLGAALLAAVAFELRLAAMELPHRHPVPADVAEGTRTVPAYLAKSVSGRVLSVAPTEYEVEDFRQLADRHPDLDPAALFAYKTALKLDEVMSPNVPLRYGLRTVDGYDGGVLPLGRYLEIASLLVPRAELRPDGVLRTRLVAVPDEPLLRFFGIEAVIANQVKDVELAGVRFDVATARTLEFKVQSSEFRVQNSGGIPSELGTLNSQLRVELPAPLALREVALLGSTARPLAHGEEVGALTVARSDGSRDRLPLRFGEHVFGESAPGPISASQPRATGGPEGRFDSAVRLDVPEGPPATSLEWEWRGSAPWTLRAATALTHEGGQEALVLQPGLRRIGFPNLKVYVRAGGACCPSSLDDPQGDDFLPRGSLEVKLATRAETADDSVAVARIRTEPAVLQGELVLLAPSDQLPPPRLSPQALSPQSTTFARLPGPPERIVYRRLAGDGSGYLVVDDAWFPGWRAYVDGAEVPLYRANAHFKAVWVPNEPREVTLSYEPDSLRWGAVISLGALAVALALLPRRRGL